MRTVAIRWSPQVRRIVKLAQKEDVVLRSIEGDQVLLSLIDEFDYEVAAQRRNKRLMAFLKERFRRARKEKGIPLEEVRRRLGLPNRSANGLAGGKESKAAQARPSHETVNVSRRSLTILNLLKQARSEELILKTTDGNEYALAAFHEGDHLDAKRRLSDVVMAYLDQLDQSRLPPLQVVFVRDWAGRIGTNRNTKKVSPRNHR